MYLWIRDNSECMIPREKWGRRCGGRFSAQLTPNDQVPYTKGPLFPVLTWIKKV